MATFQERPAALQICIKGKLGVGSLVKSASPPALMGGPALCRLLLKKSLPEQSSSPGAHECGFSDGKPEIVIVILRDFSDNGGKGDVSGNTGKLGSEQCCAFPPPKCRKG
jgi:hypothetical protein